jgi:hypothetical protein
VKPTKNFEHKVTRWFARTGGGTLKLPDGWYGRPMDNIQRLTFVVERPRKFVLELDERLLLIFTELETVTVEGPELVFADYKQLVFDWQRCGDPASHVSLYRSGEVRIISD